jgi:hypothetical protein
MNATNSWHRNIPLGTSDLKKSSDSRSFLRLLCIRTMHSALRMYLSVSYDSQNKQCQFLNSINCLMCVVEMQWVSGMYELNFYVLFWVTKFFETLLDSTVPRRELLILVFTSLTTCLHSMALTLEGSLSVATTRMFLAYSWVLMWSTVRCNISMPLLL